MNRILVVCDHTVTFDRARRELRLLATDERAEVFVLVCNFGPSVVRVLAQLRAAYWSSTFRRIDAVVDELTAEGWIADGMLSRCSPPEAISKVLDSYSPQTVVGEVSPAGRRRHGAQLDRTVGAHARASGRASSIRWLNH